MPRTFIKIRVCVHTLTYCMLRFLQTSSLSVHSSILKRHCPNCILSYCLPFSPFVHSESAVGEGGADDGVVLPALSSPDERRQVPSFREGPAQELLCHCDVHSSPASTAMFRLQVRPRKQKELTQLQMLVCVVWPSTLNQATTCRTNITFQEQIVDVWRKTDHKSRYYVTVCLMSLS